MASDEHTACEGSEKKLKFYKQYEHIETNIAATHLSR